MPGVGPQHLLRPTRTGFGGKAVKLTIHHEADGEGEGKFIGAVSGGWPKVIANLKSLLETGDIAFSGKVSA